VQIDPLPKTRSHGLFIAKPDSARLIWLGPCEAQEVARNPGMTYKAEPLSPADGDAQRTARKRRTAPYT
jgi:hypothetical protein